MSAAPSFTIPELARPRPLCSRVLYAIALQVLWLSGDLQHTVNVQIHIISLALPVYLLFI